MAGLAALINAGALFAVLALAAAPASPAGVGAPAAPPQFRDLEPPAAPPDFFTETYRRFYLLCWLIPLIQIATLVHAVRAGCGRQWAWVILFFPLVGAAVYLSVEVLPRLRRSGGGSVVGGLLNVLAPGRELRVLHERVAASDTIANRKLLAEACLRRGRPEEAVKIYRSCLAGPLKDDSETRLDLGGALLQAGQLEAARETLAALRRAAPNYEPEKRDLLLARTLAALGLRAEALKLYAPLAANHKFKGEEARCRFAGLLEAAGEHARANAVYRDVLQRSKGFGRHYRRDQRQWINWARQGARRTGGG